MFYWEKDSSNPNVNEKVAIFSRTVLNILNNHMPLETIVRNDRDPPCIKRVNYFKKMIAYKCFRQNGNDAY